MFAGGGWGSKSKTFIAGREGGGREKDVVRSKFSKAKSLTFMLAELLTGVKAPELKLP